MFDASDSMADMFDGSAEQSGQDDRYQAYLAARKAERQAAAYESRVNRMIEESREIQDRQSAARAAWERQEKYGFFGELFNDIVGADTEYKPKPRRRGHYRPGRGGSGYFF